MFFRPLHLKYNCHLGVKSLGVARTEIRGHVEGDAIHTRLQDMAGG